jgi:hypothetical protein
MHVAATIAPPSAASIAVQVTLLHQLPTSYSCHILRQGLEGPLVSKIHRVRGLVNVYSLVWHSAVTLRNSRHSDPTVLCDSANICALAASIINVPS